MRSGGWRFSVGCGCLVLYVGVGAGSLAAVGDESAVVLPHPILFVTQVPIPRDFGTIHATFANHRAGIAEASRGGGLWIRYPDGTLRDLTAAAGYGSVGFQDRHAIVVRDPAVHWSGQKAVFSMVVGAPEQQYQVGSYRWQLYQISGLGPSDTPVITLVPRQPTTYNNVMPVYLSDDTIAFISDRPRSGRAHLYPQLDEYERTPTNTGLWRLDPVSGELVLLDHSPSGDFEPLVDSFGRILFTRWDHLERDQLADADDGPVSSCFGGTSYGSFDYADESAGASYDLNAHTDVFPEPRSCRDDLLAGTALEGHGFNHFFPWMIRQDGQGLETVNHIGRQELHAYLARTRTDDPNIVAFHGQYPRTNPRPIFNLFHLAESPVTPGLLFGIDAPEFGTHAAGQVVSLNAAPATNPDDIVVTYVTHRVTASTSESPGPDHSGLYRDPLVVSDGTVVVAHTAETRQDRNVGNTASPQSRYAFRLRTLVPGANGHQVAGAYLTDGIAASISWWSPDVLTSYDGLLWELSPVEVVARPAPVVNPPGLAPPELQVFQQAGVSPGELQSFLVANELALIVSRNVTTRDDLDRQQPLNLLVPGGTATVALPGSVYEVSQLQIYQGDQLRGQARNGVPQAGRRVLAQPLHDPRAVAANPPHPGGAPGSVKIAGDGSMAAFVPAHRALTWQLVDDQHEAVVRERYWLGFQPGEMRVCASCHGLNKLDQVGAGVPQNPPQALAELLAYWKATQSSVWHDFFAVDTRETPYVGDFDGDGKDDIVTFTRDNPLAVGDVYVALSDGRHFGPNLKWHDWFAIHPDESVVIGDYDGDGRDDIATWLAGRTDQVYVALSLGSSMAPERLWRGPLGSQPADVLDAGDVDGDGREDLVLFGRSRGQVWVARSTGTSFLAPQQWHGFFAVSAHERPAVADLDGDGRADIVTFATDSPTARGDVYVALSTGSQFEDGVVARWWHDWFAVSPAETIRFGDRDGDGRQDVFTFLPQPSDEVYAVRSLGNALGPNQRTTISGLTRAPSDTPFVADVDGDGKADLVVFHRTEGKVRVHLDVSARPSQLVGDEADRFAAAPMVVRRTALSGERTAHSSRRR